MVVVWTISSFNYYLINFQLKYINGNVFNNTLVSGLSEVPAVILAGYFYKKIGLRYTLMGAFFISTFGSVLLLYFDTYENLVPLMVLFAKFGMAITLTLCYFGNSHIFPPIFCGTAFGICNIFAKLGTIFAPLIAEIE